MKLADCWMPWCCKPKRETTPVESDPMARIFDKAVRSPVRLSPPASEDEVRAFEAEAGIRLPEEYRAFLTRVAHGGRLPCRLLRLDEWDASYWINRADLALDLRAPCLLSPECARHGRKWVESLGVADYQRKWDNHRWSPMFGTIAVAKIGGGQYYSLVVNGPHRGRLFVWGDAMHVPPEFVPFANFAEWIEHWLDEVLAGEPVHFLDGRIP